MFKLLVLDTLGLPQPLLPRKPLKLLKTFKRKHSLPIILNQKPLPQTRHPTKENGRLFLLKFSQKPNLLCYIPRINHSSLCKLSDNAPLTLQTLLPPRIPIQNVPQTTSNTVMLNHLTPHSPINNPLQERTLIQTRHPTYAVRWG